MSPQKIGTRLTPAKRDLCKTCSVEAVPRPLGL
jgi:hypothetical protein